MVDAALASTWGIAEEAATMSDGKVWTGSLGVLLPLCTRRGCKKEEYKGCPHEF
jgi:hypothetical protein